MERRVTGEALAALGLIILGAAAAVWGFHYGLMQDGIIGPGLMPFGAGVLVAVFSIPSLTKAWRGTRSGVAPDDSASTNVFEPQPAGSDPELAKFDSHYAKEGHTGSVLIVLGSMAVTIYLAPWLGLIVAFSCLTFVIYAWAERLGIVKSLLISVGVGISIWLIFVEALDIYIPNGSLFGG